MRSIQLLGFGTTRPGRCVHEATRQMCLGELGIGKNRLERLGSEEESNSFQLFSRISRSQNCLGPANETFWEQRNHAISEWLFHKRALVTPSYQIKPCSQNLLHLWPYPFWTGKLRSVTSEGLCECPELRVFATFLRSLLFAWTSTLLTHGLQIWKEPLL